MWCSNLQITRSSIFGNYRKCVTLKTTLLLITNVLRQKFSSVCYFSGFNTKCRTVKIYRCQKLVDFSKTNSYLLIIFHRHMPPFVTALFGMLIGGQKSFSFTIIDGPNPTMATLQQFSKRCILKLQQVILNSFSNYHNEIINQY